MTVTPSEFGEIVVQVIAATLSIDKKCLPASCLIGTEKWLDSRARSAEMFEPTDITTITESLTNSDGSAVLVTFDTTPSNMDRGEAVSRFLYCPKATKKERGAGNTHPTVKPLALMRWLVRLVTPPEGVVVDPFSGTGTTLLACIEEGFGFVGIDNSPEYCEIALRRLRSRES